MRAKAGYYGKGRDQRKDSGFARSAVAIAIGGFALGRVSTHRAGAFQ